MLRQIRPSETNRAPCRARRRAHRPVAGRAASGRRDDRSRPGALAVYFFVPSRNKFLDPIYIMRNSIKINRPTHQTSGPNAKEAPDGPLFLAARLFDGHADFAV